jgi:hypothetical protein
VTVLYDRRTPKHNWELIVSDPRHARLQQVAAYYRQTAGAHYPRYAQKIVEFDCRQTGGFPASLPCNDTQGHTL